MKWFLPFIILCFSCSPLSTKKTSKVSLDKKLNSSLESYFLPSLPHWANTHPTGQCRRSFNPTFLHLNNVMNSFHLTYSQALQLQYFYNRKLNFYSSLKKVRSGFSPFIKPKYKIVHLIWIDPVAFDLPRMKKIMSRPSILNGHPVFLSFCLGEEEIKKMIKKAKLSSHSIIVLPTELTSPYNKQGELQRVPELDLKALFEKDQKLILFIPKNSKPPKEWGGIHKIKYY